MKAVSRQLLNEQIQLNRRPAVKVEIQEYGHPAAAEVISPSVFNWREAECEGLYSPIAAVSPSDGSIIVLEPKPKFGKMVRGIHGGQVQCVKIISGGSGYTSPPDVTFSSGGNTIPYPALGLARIHAGQVYAVDVYWHDPPAYSWPPVISFSGGGGTGALAIVSDLSYSTNFTTGQLNDLTFSGTMPFADRQVAQMMGRTYGAIEVAITSLSTTTSGHDKFRYRAMPIYSPPGYVQQGQMYLEWSAEMDCEVTETLIRFYNPAANYPNYPLQIESYVKFGSITGHTLGTTWRIYPAGNQGNGVPYSVVTLYNEKHNDMVITGTPTKFAGLVYTIRISSVGATDKFRWLKELDTGDLLNGVWSPEISCSTSPTVIDGGLSISWINTTGHDLNSYWQVESGSEWGAYYVKRYTDAGSDEYEPTSDPASPHEFTANAVTVGEDGYWITNYYSSSPIKRGAYDAAHTVAIAANPNKSEVILASWQTYNDKLAGGRADTTPSGYTAANTLCCNKITLTSGDILHKIVVRCEGAGFITIGLYHSLTGYTAAIVMKTGGAVVAGLNEFELNYFCDPLASPSEFWLVFNCTTGVAYKTETGDRKYQTVAYEGLPDTFPSEGWTTDTTKCNIIGVYQCVSKLCVKSSMDCGATWASSWTPVYTTVAALPLHQGEIAMGMNAAGNVGISTNLGYTAGVVGHFTSIYCTRVNGNWRVGNETSLVHTQKKLAYDASFGWYFPDITTLYNITGQQKLVTSTPAMETVAAFLSLIDPRYSSNAGLQHHELVMARPFPSISHERWSQMGMFGDASTAQGNVGYRGSPNLKLINLVPTQTVVTTMLDWAEIDSENLVIENNGSCAIVERTAIDTFVGGKSQKFSTLRKCVLVYSQGRIFLIRDGTIYYSDSGEEWSVPALGTGAGSKITILNESPHNILSMTATSNSNSVGTVSLTLNNKDGTFDNVGSGDLAVMKLNSLVSVYAGYYIEGVVQYGKPTYYYIDNWGYSRSPNLSTFQLHGVDAWGLLDRYVFNKPARFNQYSPTGAKMSDYNMYELIELLVRIIGGGLVSDGHSASLLTHYPKLEISTGDTAGQVLSGLLAMCDEELRFDGVNGYLYHPQTSDPPTYLFKFPVM